jgi:hypothetical protein
MPAHAMSRRARAIALSATLIAQFAVGAHGQTVRRCEGGDGKITYANTDCPAGTKAARELTPADSGPSPSDQKAARERAQKEAQELARINAEKKKAELQAAREQAARDKKAQAKERECRKLEQQARDAKEALANAPLNKQAAAERKFKRAQAWFDLNCAK